MSDWNLDLPNYKAKRIGFVELRPVARAKKKKIEKPFAVMCRSVRAWYRWHEPLCRKFATEEQARKWIEREQRRYSCHPSTDGPWSYNKYWIEGPKA